ncbi:hypothetical protein RDV89_00920 [Nocardioides zeae]|uniref:Uncharacterized protein n=1 Tax=Nocardioides imazamoxiresistens TaxID=3231893 RepID=A0ABU3PQW1_9ACTN|nr:hypothetical protein [Nocardioides zeae]MDT9591608.1 hypothetical protein [Nocardioides zeae]
MPGLSTDSNTAPDWVTFTGCVTDPLRVDRVCGACGLAWRADEAAGPRGTAQVSRRGDVRLTGPGGASFALMRAQPAAPHPTRPLSLDVEMLSPERLVRFLARPTTPDFIRELEVFCIEAAAAHHPEQSVSGVSDNAAGITIDITGSSPTTVDLVVTVVVALGADVRDHDHVHFEAERASLIGAAHDLRGLLP